MNNELKKVNWIFVDDSSSIVYKGFLCPDTNNILIDEDTFKIVFKYLFHNRKNNVLEEQEKKDMEYIMDNKVYNDSLKTFLYTLDGYNMEIVESNYFQKPEEAQQIISGLLSINELMSNGMFQLDNETEEELISCGAIEMEVEEMQLCLESTISILESFSKFINKKEGSK